MSVPKIIHYCWFGPKEIPEMEQKCIASWKKVLPDYKIMFWNEQNFDVNSVPYVREAYEKGKYAFVSDYEKIRSSKQEKPFHEIILQVGGMPYITMVEFTLIRMLKS